MNSKPEPKDKPEEHGHQVKITINGKEYRTHRGLNTVQHLRQLGNVPADEILSQFKDGQWIDLDNKDHLEIAGGEVFASHIVSCGSS